jgi:hypothetical protein
MTVLCPQLLLGAAHTMIGLNHVRRWVNGGAELVDHVGFHSHFDQFTRSSSWPLPRDGDCETLARFADARKILSDVEPTVGELFLRWSRDEQRFDRTGIVMGVGKDSAPQGESRQYECATIEGGSENPEQDTAPVVEGKRTLCPDGGDRFIRWVDLDGRAAASEARGQRWDQFCNWPHAVLSPEEEGALTKKIEKHRPFIERAARVVSEYNESLAMDLEQEATILLWRFGVARLEQEEDRYVQGAIVKRMQKVRYRLWRKAGGDKAVVVHITKAA